MNKYNHIFLLTDYKGNFGSHWKADPYRSGFDLKLVKNEFKKNGYKVIISSFEEIINNNKEINGIVLYTSSEDLGYHYKDFIEDVIYGLEIKGVKIIPSFEYLRATNNKVFMEILSKIRFGKTATAGSRIYGTLENLLNDSNRLNFPFVIKRPAGAMSKGVFLARNFKELKLLAAKASRTPNIFSDIKDYLRRFVHKGYKTDSRHRKKFITQNFIPNLENDWKVLIFGDKFFIFSRPVRKNDFRASGSGSDNYSFGSDCKFSYEIFDFAKSIFNEMNTPHLSIDIVFDGKNFHAIEFQALFFGTVGVIKSDVFYKKTNDGWTPFKNNIELESVYVQSILHFLKG